ncbi:hypothetical protein DIRTYBETTY_155 [Bacillus phage DirtyBetty]|uniref:Uncharacterized protein n=2 Tax=Wphvirus megatron TaxID=1987728 RepID=A0A1B1PAW0_9CAUD|nr:hypothetical protein QLX47_gp153 [Bacillus phage Eyuki]YP_009285097.1 hypothetical protein BIZ88_gp155 [Bacillus phage DirtyBetty]ALA46611.1 hypothetical protein EYUKI_153 [Bacillus phage Eyuki]ANT41300.1 hypothetical protein DIRTYBETTY_155 [Bacillus phage DirtyBetty]
MNVMKKIVDMFFGGDREKREQTCEVFCPSCSAGMIKEESKVRYIESERYYRFICRPCGKRSVWDFDNFPVPIFIREE